MRRVLGIAVVTLLFGTAPAWASSLVGQWHFDEGYGTVAHDSSGHNNTGTLQGSQLPSWVAGESGDALRFNGVDSNVNVPDSSSLVTDSWSFTRSLGGAHEVVPRNDRPSVRVRRAARVDLLS
jgi:hypothetical protein